MSKEARALLKKINDKKNAIKALVNEGKTKEAKEAKAELVDMQDRFNILMDLEEDEDEGIKDQIDKDEALRAEGKDSTPTKKDVVRAYVNRIVCGMRKTKMDEKDKKIMDAMSEKTDDAIFPSFHWQPAFLFSGNAVAVYIYLLLNIFLVIVI